MAFQFEVRSDKDTHFTGAIAQNAMETENIVLPGALAGIGGDAKGQLKSIAILSDQNLAWEVMLFRTDGFDDTDLDVDSFVGRWAFAAADGVQIAGAGPFRYYIDGLDEQYTDNDKTGELHIALINRSATGKNAGATGEVVVMCRFLVPQWGG